MNTTKISPRERQIMQLLAYEFRTKEIADVLYISVHTVQTHRRNMLEKLNVRNTAGLIRKGFEMGVLSVENQRVVAFG